MILNILVGPSSTIIEWLPVPRIEPAFVCHWAANYIHRNIYIEILLLFTINAGSVWKTKAMLRN